MKSLSLLKQPLAIAMWDSSWLRRHYCGGGFEDWDQALSELKTRGYNAVRIDAFPHLVADGPDGQSVETFKNIPDHHPNFYGFGMWGSPWTHYIKPRRALADFIRRCGHHGVKVGLSTWFKPTADHRNEQIEGAEGIVRVWDETLRFLEKEGLLDHVVFVDPLNEIPYGFAMQWYHDQFAMRKYPEPPKGTPFNRKQSDFVRAFFHDVITGLQKKWPSISVGASITCDFGHVVDSLDLSVLDFLDSHIWINLSEEFIKGTDYWETIGRHGHPDYLFKREPISGGYAAARYRLIPQDVDYDRHYALLLDRWTSRRAEWKEWLEKAVSWSSEIGRRLNIPVGCTEGWGMILWTEHPLLGWTLQREAAEMAVPIAADHGFLFNCSANFCHPHHVGFWRDVEWHQRITAAIKAGKGGGV